MATRKATTPSIERSLGESAGIALREIRDSESSIVRGYMAASDPALIERRREVNALRRAALTEQLLAELG